MSHGIEVKLGLPVPLLSSASIVERIGPRIGDLLTERVEFIVHLEIGDILADLVVDDLGIEAHRGDIERIAMFETSGVSLHDLDCSSECVGHIHHIHESTGLEGAMELFPLDSGIIDIHGIVGGASTGRLRKAGTHKARLALGC